MKSVKQVIVMRKDLSMRKGKMIAQGAHASMKVLLDNMWDMPFEYEDDAGKQWRLDVSYESPLEYWLEHGFAKICVYVNSEEELLELLEKAKEAELPCALITDAGRTEFGGIPTNTCIAIGPAYVEDIDPITGHLKLL